MFMLVIYLFYFYFFGTGTTETLGGTGSGLDSSFTFTPKTMRSEALEDITMLSEYLKRKGSSIDKEHLKLVGYCCNKYSEIMGAVRDSIESVSEQPMHLVEDDFREMLQQLKDKYSTASTYAEKIAVLSVLPKSWSASKIMKEFDIQSSRHLINTTKKLVSEQGILPTRLQKVGHGLSQEVLQKVKTFYEEDEVYMLPGKKDCFSVKVDGKKEKIQKRLLLNTVNELYAIFCSNNPDIKISFSTFAALRPRYCVLAHNPGTHTVCVCTYHQNFQLMIDGAGLERATKHDDYPISDAKSAIKLIKCDPITEQCVFGNCNECPGSDKVQEIIELSLDIECLESVIYQQWMKKDKSTYWSLETITQDKEDFSNAFLDALKKLVEHDFVASKQKEYFSKAKAEDLGPDEAVISMDFSENYSFVVQKAIQAYHWSNIQATVHPFIAYFRNEEGEINHVNFIVISDHMKHGSESVYVFLQKFLEFLKRKVLHLKRVKYFTDGCSAQYKSFKTVSNLIFHFSDFGLLVEHHYFATSHGKTANDGLGGTFKRAATHASIRGTDIRNPKELYEWALKKWSTTETSTQKIFFAFVSSEEIEEQIPKLEDRHELALPLPNITQAHFIRPISSSKVVTKFYSSSLTEKTHLVRVVREIPLLEQVQVESFVAVFHDNTWYMAQVSGKSESDLTVDTFKIYAKDQFKSSGKCNVLYNANYCYFLLREDLTKLFAVMQV